MAHTLVVIGPIGLKRAYLDVPRERALERYRQTNPDASADVVDEFQFEDEFLAYEIWEL